MTDEEFVAAAVASALCPPRVGSWVRVIGEAFNGLEGEVVDVYARGPWGPTEYGVYLQMTDDHYYATCLYTASELMVLR